MIYGFKIMSSIKRLYYKIRIAIRKNFRVYPPKGNEFVYELTLNEIEIIKHALQKAGHKESKLYKRFCEAVPSNGILD